MEQVQAFALDGEPLFIGRFGNGHINETYLVVDSTGRQYLLQKINGRVFHEPVALMENVAAVTRHIRSRVDSHRNCLTLLPTKDGGLWHVDDKDEVWRLFEFITDNICFQGTDDPDIFRESAVAFGRFQQQLSDFPAHTLTETIPHFHDTPFRFERFKEVVSQDSHGRVASVRKEIDFVLARASFIPTLVTLQEKGELPLRVTHNDTKLNNVLFDRISRKALCVIDLDTVMPGLAVNDFGDSIRFGASTALEDETDLSKVSLSLSLFSSYTSGYLSACGSSLTPAEIAHLHDGAKMMTLECGMRFLTDYLEGDIYFRIHRPEHNLDRCRTQFALVADMESKWDAMQDIVKDIVSKEARAHSKR